MLGAARTARIVVRRLLAALCAACAAFDTWRQHVGSLPGWVAVCALRAGIGIWQAWLPALPGSMGAGERRARPERQAGFSGNASTPAGVLALSRPASGEPWV